MIRLAYIGVLVAAALAAGCDRFDEQVVPDKDKIFRKFFGGFDNQTAVQVIQQPDNSFIMYGSSTSFSGANDAADDPELRMYLVKTDARGDEIWAQVYSDSTGQNTLLDIRPDISAVAMVETTSGFTLLGNKDKTALSTDTELILIFTDAEGVETGRNKITTPNSTIGRDIIQVADGGYIIVGFETNQANGVLVIRTDASGNQIDFEIESSLGFSASDIGEGVISYLDRVTSEPRFAIFGTSTLSLEEPPSQAGQSKLFLLIIGEDGGEVASDQYAKVAGNQGATDFKQTTDGGFILMGRDVNSEKVYLIKTSPLGISQWEQLVRQNDPEPNVAAIDATGISIIQTLDGGYAIVGHLEGLGSGDSDIFLERTDPFGVPLSTFPEPKTFGGPRSDLGGDLVETPDRGFALLGSVNLEGTNSLMNLIKTNPNGELIDF